VDEFSFREIRTLEVRVVEVRAIEVRAGEEPESGRDAT